MIMKNIEVVAAIIHDNNSRIFANEGMVTLRMAGSFLGERWSLGNRQRKP